MAAVFSLTLGISIVGLVTLLVLKRYEMSTGHVLFSRLRPRAGRFFHRTLVVVERGVPRFVGGASLRLVRAVRTGFHRVLARAIVFFEQNLERVLHLVREQSQMPRGGAAASQFLQEVAAHKQKLLRRAPSKRVIFED